MIEKRSNRWRKGWILGYKLGWRYQMEVSYRGIVSAGVSYLLVSDGGIVSGYHIGWRYRIS